MASAPKIRKIMGMPGGKVMVVRFESRQIVTCAEHSRNRKDSRTWRG
jgi:hypothetical protein